MIRFVRGIEWTTTGTATFQMFAQKWHPRKRFTARGAWIFFDFWMGLEMSTEIRPIGKSSSTVMARERFFTSVGSDMSLQQPRPGESFSTQVTFARQRMRANVHFQRTERCVHFWTKLAAKWFLRQVSFGDGTVELAMFGKSRIGRVGFSTIGTLITRRRRVSSPARDRSSRYARIGADTSRWRQIFRSRNTRRSWSRGERWSRRSWRYRLRRVHRRRASSSRWQSVESFRWWISNR